MTMVALLLAASLCGAEPLGSDRSPTRSIFLQSGIADGDTRSLVGGVAWEWNWRKRYARTTVTGYSELAIGWWMSPADGSEGSHTATQIGFTPVLRLQSAAPFAAWFVELGIGANVIAPRYQSGTKQFSTAFNFGDHVGVGRMFGRDAKREIALRVQHFSNGGIKSPNPGENFLQLRYSSRF